MAVLFTLPPAVPEIPPPAVAACVFWPWPFSDGRDNTSLSPWVTYYVCLITSDGEYVLICSFVCLLLRNIYQLFACFGSISCFLAIEFLEFLVCSVLGLSRKRRLDAILTLEITYIVEAMPRLLPPQQWGICLLYSCQSFSSQQDGRTWNLLNDL